MIRTHFSIAALLAILVTAVSAADGRVLDSMDALSFQQPKEKATVELVDGKEGAHAIKFTFADQCLNAFCFSKIRGKEDWDSAAGISFWVKGDGSANMGGIQFVWNEDYGVRYGYAFPIDSTDWKKITIRWSDLLPETSNAKALPLGKDGNAPSKLGAMWVGKWWYWKNFAAHSFAIDDIRLEATIPPPADAPKPASPLAHVVEKLKAKQPITVVTMGDSLTDYAHWANKPINWPTLFKEKLKAKFGSEVTIVNPAMGGTELRQNVVLIPRWLKQAPEPDLVTICFGFNDWNSGMRGEMFEKTMADAIDRVRRATNGKADVLVITTNPAVEYWDTLAELAEAVRKAAAAKGAALADTYAAFHEEGKTDRAHLYCNDKTHMGPPGHEVIAKTVFAQIEAAAK
jgi:lysophospholipase L1-like esterase